MEVHLMKRIFNINKIKEIALQTLILVKNKILIYVNLNMIKKKI